MELSTKNFQYDHCYSIQVTFKIIIPFEEITLISKEEESSTFILVLT